MAKGRQTQRLAPPLVRWELPRGFGRPEPTRHPVLAAFRVNFESATHGPDALPHTPYANSATVCVASTSNPAPSRRRIG